MTEAPQAAAAQTAAQTATQPAPGADVLWSDVEPIFIGVCAKCHSDYSMVGGPPEGLRLDSWEHALAADERVAVVPGNPEMSEIWRRITGLSDPRMPHDGPPWLPDDDIRLIRDWIAQGARAADGSPAAHFIRRDAGERTAISDAIIEFDQLYADTIAKKQGDLLL